MDVRDDNFAEVIAQIRNKKSYYAPVLPAQKEAKKVLVLDLDETLIHTSFTKPVKYDYESEVRVVLGRSCSTTKSQGFTRSKGSDSRPFCLRCRNCTNLWSSRPANDCTLTR